VVEGGLEVAWIDAPDASPERQLKTVSLDEIKGLNAKLKIKKAKPAAVAVAKPQVAGASNVVIPPAQTSVAAPATQPTPPTSATTTASKAPKAPKAGKKQEAAPPAPAPVSSPVPAKEVSMEDAWATVCASKGDNEDQVVEEAWIAATTEVAGQKDQEQITPGEWAKVRDIVLKDLAA
jgi:hypothetical protein